MGWDPLKVNLQCTLRPTSLSANTPNFFHLFQSNQLLILLVTNSLASNGYYLVAQYTSSYWWPISLSNAHENWHFRSWTHKTNLGCPGHHLEAFSSCKISTFFLAPYCSTAGISHHQFPFYSWVCDKMDANPTSSLHSGKQSLLHPFHMHHNIVRSLLAFFWGIWRCLLEKTHGILCGRGTSIPYGVQRRHVCILIHNPAPCIHHTGMALDNSSSQTCALGSQSEFSA